MSYISEPLFLLASGTFMHRTSGLHMLLNDVSIQVHVAAVWNISSQATFQKILATLPKNLHDSYVPRSLDAHGEILLMVQKS